MEINGGSRETEEKELTVRPCGWRSESKTVAMVTPVAEASAGGAEFLA
jgi:hypothetical protein